MSHPAHYGLAALAAAAFLSGAKPDNGAPREVHVLFPEIRKEYLAEPADIPAFWMTTAEEVSAFLQQRVRKGKVERIGQTAGGRPIRAVFYGEPRQGKGTTTFSGALGFRDLRAYFGPDHQKRVYLAMGAVHGGEFEGIAGIVNLLAVLETGSDLKGKAWPEINALAGQVHRIILIPITNVDGRARIPLRMEKYWETDNRPHEYLNTGARLDGENIGWPQCKEHIPLDFSTVQFPGGYPNDAGVNLQHDDFFGKRQPETEALFALTARERPDVILNMHTGAPPRNYYTRMHRPFIEPALTPHFEELYRRVHTALTRAGLQSSTDEALEADPKAMGMSVYNLDTALNLHCGALAVLIEAPSHSFSGTNRQGERVRHTPEALIDAQLVCHQEALRFLVERGGRCAWK
ncbi:MAG: M14 family zinc carboxypeptidase [Armatimonadota bacterium]|nr:M14 family zinc carboxypeptidase [Armatimonadota bacterium]